MATLLITHDDCDKHVTPEGHPEQVARLAYIRAVLDGPEFDQLSRMEAPMGSEAQIVMAHPQRYIDRVKSAVPTSGYASLDGDTHLAPGSLTAAYRGVGAVTEAVEQVMRGDATNAFCAIRPPGHHAEHETAMGFCLFGNVAIAAKILRVQHGLSRVAVVDFDVHHGNGTEDLVKDDAGILFISSHQMPLYPGTGYPSETGPHGTIMNVALPPGSKGTEMRHAYQTAIFPRLRNFDPEFILVSAGFDAHAADPLAQLMWLEEDYAWLTRELCKIARDHCGSRLVSVLEGGYDLDAIAASAAIHVQVLMEESR
ncbi:MAG: histone deacetylase family protein [Pseudomonadota bacterium]